MRTVFVSYYHGDQQAVDAFVDTWTVRNRVFVPRMIDVSDDDEFINSTNPDYVMGRIRDTKLQDASVTLVLLGKCTHSRRYVDWEIKASLQQGSSLPNGLLAILLPPHDSVVLPDRLSENWVSGEARCFARYRFPPTSADELFWWIEDAYSARTTRAHLISNSREMMGYNARCRSCGVTH